MCVTGQVVRRMTHQRKPSSKQSCSPYSSLLHSAIPVNYLSWYEGRYRIEFLSPSSNSMNEANGNDTVEIRLTVTHGLPEDSNGCRHLLRCYCMVHSSGFAKFETHVINIVETTPPERYSALVLKAIPNCLLVTKYIAINASSPHCSEQFFPPMKNRTSQDLCILFNPPVDPPSTYIHTRTYTHQCCCEPTYTRFAGPKRYK